MTVACDLSPGPGPHRACVPEGRPNTAARSIPKISFFKADTVLNTSTGDKSPAYFLVVLPGHTAAATALNAGMSKLQDPFGAEARSIFRYPEIPQRAPPNAERRTVNAARPLRPQMLVFFG